MSRFVVDASVAVKWYVSEIHSDAALEVLDGKHDLHVPDLFFPEFGNILWKKERRGELTGVEAGTIIRALSTVPLSSHSSAPLAESALELALDTGRTVYGSLYLALAVALGCPLLTADDRLHNALQATTLAGDVRHVRDPLP